MTGKIPAPSPASATPAPVTPSPTTPPPVQAAPAPVAAGISSVAVNTANMTHLIYSAPTTPPSPPQEGLLSSAKIGRMNPDLPVNEQFRMGDLPWYYTKPPPLPPLSPENFLRPMPGSSGALGLPRAAITYVDPSLRKDVKEAIAIEFNAWNTFFVKNNIDFKLEITFDKHADHDTSFEKAVGDKAMKLSAMNRSAETYLDAWEPIGPGGKIRALPHSRTILRDDDPQLRHINVLRSVITHHIGHKLGLEDIKKCPDHDDNDPQDHIHDPLMCFNLNSDTIIFHGPQPIDIGVLEALRLILPSKDTDSKKPPT